MARPPKENQTTPADAPASALPKLLWGTAQMCAFLGVSDRRLQQLVDEGVAVRESRGKYNAFETIRAYLGFVKDGDEGEVDSDAVWKKERARWTKGRADQVEIKNAMLLGEIVLVSDAVALLAEEEAEVRAGIEATEPELIAQLANVARTHGEVALLVRAAHQKAFSAFTQDGPNPTALKISSIPPDLLVEEEVDSE
ncbi:hypothetical protein [Tabrizicola soli]|uniref:Terminase small subunit n=1 Tax=Tabrizicola soli TaxID=2185115 RepID=A0ABV7DZG3_9RHOB|nr:hypothetical protein [Tabrizicola soli]